jgi:hypothetical protein
MDTVVLLWHIHEMPEGQDDEKLIGVHRTGEDARAAIEWLRDKLINDGEDSHCNLDNARDFKGKTPKETCERSGPSSSGAWAIKC